MSVRVSVIVPTCRRPELLERTLSALLAQHFPSGEFEILVSDDGADPATQSVLEQMVRGSLEQSGPPVRYLSSPTSRGPAAARNRACRQARGHILAFTDDDTIPDPSWLSQGVAAIEAGVDAAAGRIAVPLPAGRPTDYQRDVAGLRQAEFATANCFVLTSAFWDVDGFDEHFAAAWREDSDLQFRLLDAGYSIVSAPEALVVHPVRPARWGVSVQQQRKSQYNALLYKKHPQRYRRQIQPRPPIGYYLSVASVIGFATTLRQNRALATGSLALWSILTARLARKRLSGSARTPSHIAEMGITSAVIPWLSVFWRLIGAVKFRVAFL